MIIDCVADLHGHYPELDGGDLLIIAGDLTAGDRPSQYLKFREWLREQNYTKKIIVGGNHDGCIEGGFFYFNADWLGAEYLLDSGSEFEGLKIWGSPWTPLFVGVNPHCTAYMRDDKYLEEMFSKVPDDIDILVTHGPVLGKLDNSRYKKRCGSKSLAKHWDRVKPKLHVFGHLHENAGNYKSEEFKCEDGKESRTCISLNCSIVDADYNPVNKPVRVIVEEASGLKTFNVKDLCLIQD